MEIKNYKRIRNNIYEIELDNFKKFKLYDDIILKYELLIDKRLTEKKLEKIINDNNSLDAYYKALKYINIKMRSELEIRNYLQRQGFNIYEIDYATKRLREDGYINEEQYVQAYIHDALSLTLNGKKKILSGLVNLGLEETMVLTFLEEIESSEWISRIKKVLEKKSKTNKSSEKMFKNKMVAELLNLGYDYEDIKSCLDDFKVDASDVFLKEAEKVFAKLSLKYTGTELVLFFKQKMFNKGFSYDEISEYINNKEL